MMLPFIPFPTRISPLSGAYALASTGYADFSGRDAKQLRVLFCVVNTHATDAVQLRTGPNNRIVATIPASTGFAIATNAPIQVYNPNAGAVTVNVLELFPDIEIGRGDFHAQMELGSMASSVALKVKGDVKVENLPPPPPPASEKK